MLKCKDCGRHGYRGGRQYCYRFRDYLSIPNKICKFFERKPMSDQIKINVEVNGQPGSLADVSPETLMGMRNKAVPTEVVAKPIKHGDYGYVIFCNGKKYFRLYLQSDDGNGVIAAFDKIGHRTIRDINENSGQEYVSTGNIFKDMQEKTNDNS